MINKYEIIIYWSDEDRSFVAEVPELPGCMAHGDTYDSALANIKDAMNLWIDTAKEFDDPIPVPKGRRLAFA
ncbi:type II toxin-antitoxin system HicB family antitoxin [Desulfonema magnum]|uniref:Toxin-antitoxin system, antitoxin component, HicB domain-containing protein n=1 Tax=Desulfonema magnum TaxID=45655 RepID=A0A975BK53_9BACT|nr:type II toxin-antitoxin system HicB family antitoxin [Desulfonema magnum]QTA87142.1 Toxin-antitoxin system, antitoxin component, HicB domain-containing protein [Desulfonema magnum]